MKKMDYEKLLYMVNVLKWSISGDQEINQRKVICLNTKTHCFRGPDNNNKKVEINNK